MLGNANVLYLLWLAPVVLLIVLIGVFRQPVIRSALLGAALALVVAFLSAPKVFGLHEAVLSVARGSWIGLTVVPYILGGLLFWRVASLAGRAVQPDLAGAVAGDASEKLAYAQRRILFNACFLIGPFAESVTGFGVGMMGTFALLASLSLRPAYLLAFGFIGQALGPWGGMASGTLIAAALAGSDPATFAIWSGGIVCVVLLAWLPLFWRLAEQAGLGFPREERRKDAAWLAATLVLLLLMTWLGGPETGLIASFGPVIALRYFLGHDARFSSLLQAARQVWPYILLVGILALTRLIPSWARFLRDAGSIRPFENLPAFSPMFHSGVWLMGLGLLVAVLVHESRRVVPIMRESWASGKTAIFTTALFCILAEVLSLSGIATSLAAGMLEALGRTSVFLSMMLAALFGLVTNSANASNGLLMNSQLALAHGTGLSALGAAALQHASAIAMSTFSPVRIMLACGFAGVAVGMREVYRTVLPFMGVVVVIVLLVACVLLAYAGPAVLVPPVA
ncbi:L-lactate permease [Kerstersia similis]